LAFGGSQSTEKRSGNNSIYSFGELRTSIDDLLLLVLFVGFWGKMIKREKED